jgi:hypothetical protein
MAPEPAERSACGQPRRFATSPAGRLARAPSVAHCPALTRNHVRHRCLQRQPQHQARSELSPSAGSPGRPRRPGRAHHRPGQRAGEPGTADLLPRPAASAGGGPRTGPAPALDLILEPLAFGSFGAYNGARTGPQPGISSRRVHGSRHGRDAQPRPGHHDEPGARAACCPRPTKRGPRCARGRTSPGRSGFSHRAIVARRPAGAFAASGATACR